MLAWDFWGMELPWLRCPEPLCGKGQKEKQVVSAGEPTPAYSTGQCWHASALGDTEQQLLGSRRSASAQLSSLALGQGLPPAPRSCTVRAPAAPAPSLGSAPSSRPAAHRATGSLCWLPGSRERGDREGSVRVVSARGCVCVHILTEGLSPRLTGPRGRRKGLCDPGEP